MSDRRANVYISAQQPLGPFFAELLSELRHAGLRPSWTDGFQGFPRIGTEIATSAALIAVITDASRDSTSQAIEVSYALGYRGSGQEFAPPRAHPVFVYATTDRLPGCLH